jgi:alkylhydroperoxidase/carboxymuconolactone decarboxylase family protein YurZ
LFLLIIALAAIVTCYLNGDQELVNAVRRDYKTAPISEKLKSLLQIAGKVQQSGKAVLPEDIENAKLQGATDRDIHDTVLIAAAFCLFNRYVDGLASIAPQDLSTYPLRLYNSDSGIRQSYFLKPQ